MKVTCKSFEEQPYPKVVIDQQEAVGSSNGEGFLFDSGCNLSGVRKIHIYVDLITRKDGFSYPVIKRIGLEFETPFQTGECLFPSYNTGGKSTSGSLRTIDIDKNDFIVRIDVWTPKIHPITGHKIPFVTGIRFGSGSSRVPDASFEGNDSGSKLVGVHGFYAKAIVKLGFTFATVTPTDTGGPPMSVEAIACGTEFSIVAAAVEAEPEKEEERWQEIDD